MTEKTIITCDQCKKDVGATCFWKVSFEGLYNTREEMHFCGFGDMLNYLKEAEIRMNTPVKDEE